MVEAKECPAQGYCLELHLPLLTQSHCLPAEHRSGDESTSIELSIQQRQL